MESATPRTVGRAREVAHLRALLDDLSVGAGSAALLRGEAGVGKSHLVDVAIQIASTSGVEVVGTGTDELTRDRPAHVLSQAMDALAPFVDRQETSSTTRAGEVVGGDDPGYRLIDRFVAAVEIASTARPVLFVAEDLHWADELSLRGIATLIAHVDPLPCVVLATSRPHPRPRRIGSVESAIAAVEGRMIELGGLGTAAAEELAGSILGARPGTSLRAALAGAAGNPFMIEQLVEAATRGDLVRTNGNLAEIEGGQALPASLHEVLLRSIESVPSASVEVLRLASLFGTRFTATEVAALARRPVVDVVSDLRAAVESRLVAADENVHRFRHDLVREAVYESIGHAARWDLHRAAAVALIHLDAPALRVAEQFSAGARPGDLDAVSWLRRAAEEALVIDTGAAADLLRRALTLAPPDWPDRFDCEADMVELLAWSGRIDEARSRGERLVDRALDPHERFRAHRALGTLQSSVGDLGSAARELRSAAGELGADTERAAVLVAAAAGMEVIAGERSPAAADAEVRPLVAGREPDGICAARNTLAVTSMSLGDYGAALDHARASAAILDDSYVRPLGFLIPHSWVAAALMYLDRFDEAHEAMRAGRVRAVERGDTGLLMHLIAGTCGLTWASADWDETTAELEAATVLADETGVVAQDILLRTVASHIARERGRDEEADALLDKAAAIAASGTKHLFGLEVLCVEQARMARRHGALDDACELLVGVWEATASIRGLIQWRLMAPEVVGACIAAGRQREAEEVVAQLHDVARRSKTTSATATVQRCTGLVRHDGAMLVTAADEMLSTPRLAEAAGACEDAAAVLIDSGVGGRESDLRRILAAAERIHVRASATAGLDRISRLRARAGITTEQRPTRPAFGWESLTPKETEVVELVSRGMSNPEIAAELFISRRTVEAHLSHVFRKLDVTNRTQLAREVIDRGVT